MWPEIGPVSTYGMMYIVSFPEAAVAALLSPGERRTVGQTRSDAGERNR